MNLVVALGVLGLGEATGRVESSLLSEGGDLHGEHHNPASHLAEPLLPALFLRSSRGAVDRGRAVHGFPAGGLLVR